MYLDCRSPQSIVTTFWQFSPPGPCSQSLLGPSVHARSLCVTPGTLSEVWIVFHCCNIQVFTYSTSSGVSVLTDKCHTMIDQSLFALFVFRRGALSFARLDLLPSLGACWRVLPLASETYRASAFIAVLLSSFNFLRCAPKSFRIFRRRSSVWFMWHALSWKNAQHIKLKK